MTRASAKSGDIQNVARMLAMSRTSLSESAVPVSPPSTSSVTGGDFLPANGLRAVLRMFKIVERTSGLCLFTTQWKWHPHAHAEGVDALVQSLAQFAREIDGGEIVRIHFDSHASQRSSNSIGTGSTSSIGNGSVTPTRAKPSEDERRPSTIGEVNGTSALEMLSHHSGPVQAVLFHDRVSEVTAQRLRVFVEQVVDRFLELHRVHVARLEPHATAVHHSALTTAQLAAVTVPFATFNDVLQHELMPTL